MNGTVVLGYQWQVFTKGANCHNKYTQKRVFNLHSVRADGRKIFRFLYMLDFWSPIPSRWLRYLYHVSLFLFVFREKTKSIHVGGLNSCLAFLGALKRSTLQSTGS